MNISMSISNYHLLKENIDLKSSLSATAADMTSTEIQLTRLRSLSATAGMSSREIWLTRLRSFKYYVEWVMLLRDLYSLLEGPMRWFIYTIHTIISAAIAAAVFNDTVQFSHNEIREEKSFEVDMKIIMESLGLVSDDEDMSKITCLEDITSLFDENEPTLDELKEAFGVFDTNNDGFIDAEELQLVLSKLGYSCISESDCSRMIDGYDVDKDAKISSKEFLKLVEDGFLVKRSTLLGEFCSDNGDVPCSDKCCPFPVTNWAKPITLRTPTSSVSLSSTEQCYFLVCISMIQCLDRVLLLASSFSFASTVGAILKVPAS
ncbi:hypothetical protein L2E82_26810 [Cichorium intybus]|uniref:Uncharacterized protein n=1 Tax=Cichorium intybus TaxID=13427 RepID=A0ACB9CR59_CICIN|nr:hypothetical protein L2E82_26810 [Cichorium intybus]